MQFDEKQFIDAAATHLKRCRPGDWEHAKRVASWVRKLRPPKEKLSLLLAAAYIHDIGWRDLLSSTNTITFDQLQKYEEKANKNSEPFAMEFLSQFAFAPEETKTILGYIKAADAHKARNPDEAFIVDADNLSKLCIEHLQQKYTPDDWMRMWSLWEEEMPTRIQTQEGKELFPSLLQKLKKDIEEFSDQS